MFRPSDDATVFPYLIPSNMFAFFSLMKAGEILEKLNLDNTLLNELLKLSNAIKTGLVECGEVETKKFSKIYAYEVNGHGSTNLMDDANIPSLLSLSYLIPEYSKDETYLHTRNFCLSSSNPFFFKGKAAEGIGGPHCGMDMIWPMSIIMRGLTSNDDAEIKLCLDMLQRTHAGTGFMHESFHKDDATNYTRKWFAWANTLFGEFVWKVYREKPHLLN